MRIYTNKLGVIDIHEALQSGIGRGIIASHVFFDKLEKHSSKDYARRFDVTLQAREYDGRGRRNNTGYSSGGEFYAAKFDEWGHFIAALYAMDEDAKVGSYSDNLHFHECTGDSYDPRQFAYDGGSIGDPYPFVSGSVSNGRSGRVGAGRISYGTAYRHSAWQAKAAADWYEDGHNTQRRGLYLRYAPRTLNEVRIFCGI